jgi:hypothetical protein
MITDPTNDLTLLAWVAVFVLPTAVAFARGGLFGIGWWTLANLLLGWHPVFWLVMLMLAMHRRALA